MKRLIAFVNEEGKADVQTVHAFPFAQEAMKKGAPKQLRVPYADVPYNRDGIVGTQRLNKTYAEQMVALWKIVDAENKGAPGYVGHPDYVNGSPMAEDEFLRKEPGAVVWVHSIEAGDDALLLNVDWTPDGEELVTSRKFRFFSPFFMSEDIGMEGTTRVYVPRVLRSLGLTNNPNWKMPPMINSSLGQIKPNGGAEGGAEMNKLLEKLQALLNSGKALNETEGLAELTALINSINKLRDHAKTLLVNGKSYTTDAAGLEALITDVLTDCVNAKSQITALTTERDGAKTALVSLQKSIATECVNSAVTRGAVLVEHKEQKITELINSADFSKAIECCNALPKLMKTEETKGKEAGSRTNKTIERRDKIEGLVNSAMKDLGLSYDAAFAKVRREQPDLFTTEAK